MRKVRCDKGVKRGPRAPTLEQRMRMGPVALIRLTKGYGRELPPGHAEMLRGDGVKPEWAREYGSGNSGEAGVRESETRAERVRRLLAAEASERERPPLRLPLPPNECS